MQDDSYFDLGQIFHKQLEPYGSQASCGQLTSGDLLQFVGELKREYSEPEKVVFTSQELDWVEKREQNARDIAAAFGIPHPLLGGLPSSSCSFESERDKFLRQILMDQLKTEYVTTTDADSWTITVKTYNMIRWLHHISKAYRLPSRKLRKCHLRRRTKRMRQNRKRYFDNI